MSIAEIHWANQAPFPVLSTLILTPVVGAIAARFSRSARQAAAAGFASALAEVALVIFVLFRFDPNTNALQFVEHVRILPLVSHHLGVDGISLLFLLTTALLPLLAIFYEEIVHEEPPGLYIALVLVHQAILTALFLTLDLAEFWLFACMELAPPLLILRRWGTGSNRLAAARIFLRYMLGGLAMLLAAVALLGWNHFRMVGLWSVDFHYLAATPIADSWQAYVFVLLLYGFSVRLAQFPFHAWLPLVAHHGTLATVPVFILGAKVGIYGLMRFALPLLPSAVLDWRGLAVGLGVAGIFYGGGLALMQLGLRRLLAFAAISQTGMLLVGVFTLDTEGLLGTLLLSVNFGIAASGLLFATGLVYRRAGTTLLPRLGGVFELMPILGLTFLISALSTIAMPGTPGFDAAHLLLEGAIEASDWGIAAAVAIGNVLTAAFLLWAFQRVFLAEPRHQRPPLKPTPLSRTEWLLAGVICLSLLGVGFYTEPWVHRISRSVSGLTAPYASVEPQALR